MANRKSKLQDHIRLRAITSSDEELLFMLYEQTRQDELAQVPWTAIQKEIFLKQQFFAQTTDWKSNFNHDRFLIILYKQEPIGRFYVEEQNDQLLLVDIIILQKYRKRESVVI